jgi:histidyl-tRNA synthetase
MIGKLLGREVPACGFSIGLDRLVDALEEVTPGAREPRPRRIALLFDPEADPVGDVVAHARALRAQGDVVSIETRTKNLGRRLTELEAHGFTHYGLAARGALPELKPLHGARAAR